MNLRGTALRICLAILMPALGGTTGRAAEFAAPTSLLTNLQQMATLGVDQARQQPHGARAQGVVTYQPPYTSDWFILQDGDHAVVVYGAGRAGRLQPGARVEVEGDIEPTSFSITVQRARVTRLPGTATVEAPVISPDDTRDGRLHARRVRLRGAVLDVALEGGRPTLLLASRGVSYNAFIGEPAARLPAGWLNATLELEGVAFSRTDQSGKPSGFYLLVASNSWVQTVRAGATNFADLPLRLSRDLMAAQSRPHDDDRFRVAGIVTYVSPAGFITLEDATGPVSLFQLLPIPIHDRRNVHIPRGLPVPVAAGDRLEAIVSASTARTLSPRADFAEVRVVGRETPPAPLKISAQDVQARELDSRWVSVRGVVVGRQLNDSTPMKVAMLWIRSDDTLFRAYYAASNTPALPGGRDDLVEVTGLTVIPSRESSGGLAFTVVPADERGVRVLGHQSGWRSPAALQVGGVAVVILVGALAWVYTLRQQVTARTADLARANRQLQSEVEERKRAQAELDRALHQERELGELKSRFVSMVSHEFRTPLGITMSAVELLRHHGQRLSEPQRRELCDDIFTSTRHMAGLMEQVLLLGRVEAGKLAFRPVTADLASLGHRLAEESRAATGQRCPIELHAAGDLGEAGIDEALVRHIISNLLSNAVKYSPPGAPVEFRIERSGLQAVFRIRDRGIGIPPADLPRLFQAFHRAGNVGDTPGTGLGLVIVKRCVDLHGGRIEVESPSGGGTLFTVTLPVFDGDG